MTVSMGTNRYIHFLPLLDFDSSQSACAQSDAHPEQWTPDSNYPREIRRRMEADAKAVCRTCPVVDSCADYALRNDVYGVWGAMTRRERLALGSRNAI